jgi:hypothetical protein
MKQKSEIPTSPDANRVTAAAQSKQRQEEKPGAVARGVGWLDEL